jgi:hypothetical protein
MFRVDSFEKAVWPVETLKAQLSITRRKSQSEVPVRHRCKRPQFGGASAIAFNWMNLDRRAAELSTDASTRKQCGQNRSQ